jgi:hypothetical protein
LQFAPGNGDVLALRIPAIAEAFAEADDGIADNVRRKNSGNNKNSKQRSKSPEITHMTSR